MRSVLAIASLATVALFGPPRINVTQPTGTPPVAGAVLLIEGHHHTDEKTPDVSGRMLAMRNGQRVERPVTLTAYGETGHYGVTKQWENGTPWVLLFRIRQGADGAHGTAEALVKVDAAGKIVGIESLMDRNWRGDVFPRAVKEEDITKAFGELGVRAER